MGKVFKELLEDIYDRKILSDDLSLYLHRPHPIVRWRQKAGMRFMCWLLCPTNLPKWTGWKRVNGFVCRCKNNWRTLCCTSWRLHGSFAFRDSDDFESKFNTLWGSGFQLLHSFGNPHGFGFITNRRNLRIFIFVEQAPIRERACPVWSPRPVLSKSWCLLPEWEMRMPFKNLSFQKPHLFLGILTST